jgi:DNA gyrase inhibitor GyrI
MVLKKEMKGVVRWQRRQRVVHTANCRGIVMFNIFCKNIKQNEAAKCRLPACPPETPVLPHLCGRTSPT